MRLVQLARNAERAVALVEEPQLRLLSNTESVYALVQEALRTPHSLSRLIEHRVTDDVVDYDAIYQGKSSWKLMVPIDHPTEPARTHITGTGLTHLGSATDRQNMHVVNESELTDSMKIFRWGIERGKPAKGQIGVSPEWFYKGNGTMLRAHGESLDIPPYGEDGGEEAEIAGVYIVDKSGQPWRIGMSIGNEFSDHVYEKRNYLNLASSKIRTCSLGPELVIDPDFDSVSGTASIERNGETVWSKDIMTGEANMCHSLQNVEHHHFKFASHRRPGDVHVHYFGACSLSFGHIALADADIMQVTWAGFGRPLRNPLHVDTTPNTLVTIGSLA